MLEKLKNKVFGDSQVGKFEVGEIIRWPGWHHTSRKCDKNLQIWGNYVHIHWCFGQKRDQNSRNIALWGSKPVKISLLLVKKSDLED